MKDHDAQLAKYLAGKPVAIDQTLRTLPAKANLARAVEVVHRLVEQPHWLAACGALPAHLIRRVLATPAKHPGLVFLQLAVPADGNTQAIEQAWTVAVAALDQLFDTRYALGSDDRRAGLAAIASDTTLLQAIQGVAANTAEVPVEMLVVLAIDGSDASLDALIPHLDLALGSRDARLERLALLRPFVKRTPALDALFAELDGALATRRDASPALALGETLGLPRRSQFWFSFLLQSGELNDLRVPMIQGSVRIDSREDPWFAVEVSRLAGTADRSQDQTTRFDLASCADQLGIGRCEPIDLPAWLASAARTLDITWNGFVLRTNADSAGTTRLENWLNGI